RRVFLAGAGVALGSLAVTNGIVSADPLGQDEEWIANHIETRLLGADGAPVVGLPRWTRMRILRGLPNGTLEVWVPRFNLTGRVPISAIGRVAIPTQADLDGEQVDGPEVLDNVGLPGRVVGSANLRTWPVVGDTMLRQLGHNAPVRVLQQVAGDAGDTWYRV